MVYLFDEGSIFDAPIDKIWKYLPSDQHQHSSMKLLSRELTGNQVVITAERNIMGKLVRTKIKNTLYPPFGFVQEHLEGPTAGSRAFVYYVPKGNKTTITVVGDFRLEGAENERRCTCTITSILRRRQRKPEENELAPALAKDKQSFGSSRRRRWFGL